jgi:hypothetical protein
VSPFFIAKRPICTSLCTSLGNKEGLLKESVNFFRSSNYGKFNQTQKNLLSSMACWEKNQTKELGNYITSDCEGKTQTVRIGILSGGG